MEFVTVTNYWNEDYSWSARMLVSTRKRNPFTILFINFGKQ